MREAAISSTPKQHSIIKSSAIDKQLDQNLVEALRVPGISSREIRKHLHRQRMAKKEWDRLQASTRQGPPWIVELSSQKAVEIAQAVDRLCRAGVEVQPMTVLLAATLEKKSEIFGFPIPDFDIDPAAEDEQLNACRVPQLPALKQFLRECPDYALKNPVPSWAIEEFCKNSSHQDLLGLITEVEQFCDATRGLPLRVMRKTLEKLGFESVPVNLRTLPDLATWLKYYCRKYHGNARMAPGLLQKAQR